MKQYTKYKNSNIPWLGDVPENWEKRKLKYSFKERIQKGFPNETLLAATQTKGVVPKSLYGSRTVLVQKDFHLLKLVKKDDFVISLRSFQGGIERAYFQGIISPAYTIMIPENNIIPNYFRYLGKSIPFISLLKICVTGIREGQNIDYNILKRQYLVLPNSTEQIQIARYLDWKVGQINKFIKAKMRIIGLLKEQIELYLYGKIGSSDMNAFINWDNSFPESWQMIKAKRIFSEVNIKNQSDKELLAVTQDRGVVLKKDCLQNYVSPSGSLNGLKLVRQNDFVISLRSFQGGIEYSNYEGIVSPAYNIIFLNKKYNSSEYQKYFKYLFKTKPFISQLNTIISGIRDGKNINYSDFAEILLPLPPIDYLKSFMHLLDNFESYKQRFQFERILLDEYRNRLISDVVTGKVDVRGIEVPEVIEDIEEEILEAENEELEEIEGEE